MRKLPSGRDRLGIWAFAIGAAAILGALSPSAAKAQGGGAAGTAGAVGGSRVVRLVSVGSVLTADGTIWMYRPDRKQWMTIDESFKAQGKQTHVLPLPVAVSAIQDMATFGCLLTNSGDCWLYNIESDKWEKLPAPRG